jgi:Cu(I)/Ag(I) efflux system membrane fusion protein
MKSKTPLLMLAVAALAGASGFFAAKFTPRSGDAHAGHAAAAEKTYSCSMHPQVREKKPGTCPFCGMALAPLGSGPTANLLPGQMMLSTNRINAIHVQTVAVKRQPLTRTLRVSGTIDDNDTRHRFISAIADGRVDRLFINFIGAEVSAGEPLATLFSPMLLNTEREYASLARLPASTNALVQAERIRLMDAVVVRLKRLGLTDAHILALPDKSATNLHTEILTPAAGTVINRFIYEGQYVKEGDKLFELADFSTMWFQFDAYERDLPWIRTGLSVEVSTPSAPGKSFTGAVAFIDPNIKDMSRSAKVRVELDNPLVEDGGRKRRQFLHRLSADGLVKVEVPEVLAVPRSAVLAAGAQPVVYVDKGGGIYEQRMIKLGRTGDDLVEILAGLGEDEKVVTTGNLLIDAQAQLESGTAGAHEHHTGRGAPPSASAADSGHKLLPLPPLPELNAVQQSAVSNFLALANGISIALAHAKLDDFNALVPKLHTELPALSKAFERADDWQPLLAKLHASGHLATASDTAAARKAFYPFTAAVVDLTRAARRQPAFKDVKIYACPMAPKNGMTSYWVQLQGPLQNPFFGNPMMDCGVEVKP